MLFLINRIPYGLGFIIVFVLGGCTTTAPEPTTPSPVTTPKIDCQVIVPALYGHYEGECQNGKAHGRGKAVGQDMYEGEFANGFPNGKGIYTWTDEASFDGSLRGCSFRLRVGQLVNF